MEFNDRRPWVNVGPAHAQARYLKEKGVAPESVDDLLAAYLSPQLDQLHQRIDEAPGLKQAPGQQQLFSRASVPQAEAHHQTPAQFAGDERSWWHGRYGERLTAKAGSDEGFHVGSRAAANQRLQTNYGRRAGNKPARMFPLRLTGETADWPGGPPRGSTPEVPAYDSQRHSGLGWAGRGYFYRNDVEDAGHISVGVPKRGGNLSTHREMVDQAKAEGKYVHPLIAWAAKKAPQHTGEDVMAHRNQPRPERHFADGMVGSADAPQQQLHPTQFKGKGVRPGGGATERRYVPTEAGFTLGVWRKQGGSANEPREWNV